MRPPSEKYEEFRAFKYNIRKSHTLDRQFQLQGQPAREFAIVAFHFDKNQIAAAPPMGRAAGFAGCTVERIAGN